MWGGGPSGAPRLGALETDEVGWTVVPELEYSRWTRLEQQGTVQVHFLTARLDEPGLVLDQVSGTAIRSPLRCRSGSWPTTQSPV